MRLIDADKLFEDLFVSNGKLCPNRDIDNFPVTINVEDVKKSISKQPTAYDVDKVVEQLEKLPCCSSWNHNSNNIDRIRAIEIVKAGRFSSQYTDDIFNTAIQKFAVLLSSRLTDAIRSEDVESMKNLIKDVVNELSKQGDEIDEEEK